MAAPPALTKTRDDSGVSPQGYAIGSDDNTDLKNLRDWIVAHDTAANPHSGSLGLTGGTLTGTLNGTRLTLTDHRATIENVYYGDAGTEPTVGLYTLSIGAVNYYVQVIDFEQNDLVCFKAVVPREYKAGQQILLRYGFASAGVSVVYTWNCYFGLLDSGDAIDVGLNVNTDLAQSITSGDAANKMTYDETIQITDTSGEINSVAVAAGDVIIGKIIRTDADASDFRLVSLEMAW